MESFLTIGEIAQKLDRPIWRVRYLLDARKIQPICRAGFTRLFAPGVVDTLRAEIEAIERRRKLA